MLWNLSHNSSICSTCWVLVMFISMKCSILDYLLIGFINLLAISLPCLMPRASLRIPCTVSHSIVMAALCNTNQSMWLTSVCMSAILTVFSTLYPSPVWLLFHYLSILIDTQCEQHWWLSNAMLTTVTSVVHGLGIRVLWTNVRNNKVLS